MVEVDLEGWEVGCRDTGMRHRRDEAEPSQLSH